MKNIAFVIIGFNLFFISIVHAQTDSIAKLDRADTLTKSSNIEYAFFYYYDFKPFIIYDNGDKEEILKILNLEKPPVISFNGIPIEKSVPIKIKVFKYLNKKGFVLVTKEREDAYIFRKE